MERKEEKLRRRGGGWGGGGRVKERALSCKRNGTKKKEKKIERKCPVSDLQRWWERFGCVLSAHRGAGPEEEGDRFTW